jgi:drug/metabolite transporter (DMT)-like permease
LAFFFLGETPTIFFFIGIIVEMVAIILISKE